MRRKKEMEKEKEKLKKTKSRGDLKETCYQSMIRALSHNKNRIIRQMSSLLEDAGPIELGIKTKILDSFKPSFFTIDNDSWKHSGHHGLRGAANVTESHFRMTIVSDEFAGKSQPARHRMVYKLLDEEIKEKGLHAIQLKTKTPDEWAKTEAQ